MSYKVVEVKPGARGFDTIAPLDAAQYVAMKAIGFDFRWGYLGDLTPDEIAKAHSANVGIMVIQHAHAPGWVVTGAKGAADGARALADARVINLPQALPLYCDFESPAAPATTSFDVSIYSVAWCKDIQNDGRPAEVYVGFEMPCNAEELWQLPFTGYAKSFSDVATPAHRGFKLIQLFADYPKGECFVRDFCPSAPASVASLLIDIDIAQTDYLGARPKMLVAA